MSYENYDYDKWKALARIADATERAQKVAEYQFLHSVVLTHAPAAARLKALTAELYPVLDSEDIAEDPFGGSASAS